VSPVNPFLPLLLATGAPAAQAAAMKEIKTAFFALALALPLAAYSTDMTQEAFARLGYARQAVAQDPPRNALLNSPLASHPMFNQVFASLDEKKLNEAAAQLMAEQFTSRELKALVDFQSSPEGKSIHQKMPGYQQMLGATMQGYLSVAFQQMMAKQGNQGASNIPVNANLASSTLPPMQVPAPSATPQSTPLNTPSGLPSGGGTPLKH
jgi:hypothetical protein